MGHVWERNFLLYYLLSLEGWGEASPGCLGKADISSLAVIKCKMHCSCLRSLDSDRTNLVQYDAGRALAGLEGLPRRQT